jgi:folate-binding protein YgfZ
MIVRGFDAALFRLEGRDRVRFLHNLCTQDVRALAPGQGCLATIVDRAGKLSAVFTVAARADHLRLYAPPELRGRILELLEKYRIADDVRFDVSEVRAAGYYGPEAVARVRSIPRYHWDGDARMRVPMGYEIYGGDRVEGSHEAWNEARIEAGIPLWGREIDETVLPVECGLDEAVSYSKGCYLGQEVLLRLRNFSEPKQLLRGVRLDGPRSPGPIPEGRITSVCGRPIALAILRKEFKEPGTRISAGTVSSLPFTSVEL